MPKLLRCLFALVLLVSAGGQPVKAASTQNFHQWPYQILFQTARNNFNPAIAYDPIHDQYLAVWAAESLIGGGTFTTIVGRLLNGAGSIITNAFAIANEPSPVTGAIVNRAYPSLAFDSAHGRYLVTYEVDVWGNSSDWDVYGTFVPYDGRHAGTSLSEILIATTTANEFSPKVAYSTVSDVFMVVWDVVSASTPTFISGATLSSTGALAPFTVFQGTQSNYGPDLAYNQAKDSFLVTWEANKGGSTGKDVYGDEFSPSGNEWVLGKFIIANTATDEISPAVAACYKADQYLVVWSQYIWRDDHIDYDIWGRYISGDLLTFSAPKFLVGTSLPQEAPDLTCNWQGSRYFMAWQDMYSDPYPYYGIWAMRLETDQTNSDAWDVIDAGQGLNRKYAGVAAGKTSYVVTWQHDNGVSNKEDIWSQAFTAIATFFPIIRR